MLIFPACLLSFILVWSCLVYVCLWWKINKHINIKVWGAAATTCRRHFYLDSVQSCLISVCEHGMRHEPAAPVSFNCVYLLNQLLKFVWGSHACESNTRLLQASMFSRADGLDAWDWKSGKLTQKHLRRTLWYWAIINSLQYSDSNDITHTDTFY